MTGRSRFAAGGLGSRHTGRCQEPAHRAFATLQRRRTLPAPPKGVALTGGAATDVSGAAGGVVVVAVCPMVMLPLDEGCTRSDTTGCSRCLFLMKGHAQGTHRDDRAATNDCR